MPEREPHVAVVVLNWNGLEDTRACVASLLAQTHVAREIFVVDNASANGEADALAGEFGASIRLIRNTENRGFTGGNNVAMELALAEGKARYVALLNNDAAAEPDWLARLVAAAEAHPEATVFASHMVFWSNPEITENAGTCLLSTGEAIPRGRGRPRGEFTEPARLLGACGGAVLYRADALRQVGVFRDEFFANFEDVDLSLRLLNTGAECLFVPGTFVRHKLNASIAKVRTDAFRIRSVRNMTLAYWINVPWSVALLNLPAQLVSWLLVPPLALLVGQRDLCRILLSGRWAALRQLGSIARARRERARRGNPLRIWWRQRSFFASYARFFLDVVVRRRRRYME